MAEKTMDKPRSFSTSKAHELSESEDTSSELSSSSAELNETVNSIVSSNYKNVVNKTSLNESYDSESNSKEADSSTSKVSMDIKEKIQLLGQSNEVLNSKDSTPATSKGELSIENISDQEIWMVQCPLDLDPKKLVNKEFDFSGISEFAVETDKTDKVYTATAYSDRWKTLSCLLPSSERKQLEAVVVNTAGQIIITEQVMTSQLNSIVPARNKIEFPENLKVRHPLFGADYEKELNIRRQRLLVSSKKKKKKKKERKEMPNDISYGTITEDQADDCIPSLLEDMEPQVDIAVMSKKKKKRKHSEAFNTNSDHSEDDTGKLKTKHSKKKLRKSLLSNSVDESMEIDNHINQEYSKKKKKKKKYDVE